MKLLWLDLETGGLDPAQYGILEVAALVAAFEDPFEPTGGSFIAALRTPLSSPMSAPAREMHTKSGLLEECARSLVDVADAERALLALVPEGNPTDPRQEKTTLAGSSVHFDLAFVRRLMPTLAARLSYRVYDVSAVELFCRSLGMTKLPRAEAHRALPDIHESLAIAKKCADWLRAWG
jgi:oligoribonuclease